MADIHSFHKGDFAILVLGTDVELTLLANLRLVCGSEAQLRGTRVHGPIWLKPPVRTCNRNRWPEREEREEKREEGREGGGERVKGEREIE